jgi:hypothetical protein
MRGCRWEGAKSSSVRETQSHQHGQCYEMELTVAPTHLQSSAIEGEKEKRPSTFSGGEESKVRPVVLCEGSWMRGAGGISLGPVHGGDCRVCVCVCVRACGCCMSL